MHDTARVPGKREGKTSAARRVVDDELADKLLGKAQAEGVELLGPDGLLSQVTKAVLERALAEEMTGHLGYDKHDPAGPQPHTNPGRDAGPAPDEGPGDRSVPSPRSTPPGVNLGRNPIPRGRPPVPVTLPADHLIRRAAAATGGL